MVTATTNPDGQPPAPPPTPLPPTDEPMVSVQSQIGLLVVAVLAVLGFIFHKDLGALAEPLGVIAFSIYGAAVAIARAIKHRTVTQAVLAHNSQRLDVWQVQQEAAQPAAIQNAFNAVAEHTGELEGRLAVVEAKVSPKTTAKKTASRPVKRPTRARKASAPRKTSAGR